MTRPRPPLPGPVHMVSIAVRKVHGRTTGCRLVSVRQLTAENLSSTAICAVFNQTAGNLPAILFLL